MTFEHVHGPAEAGRYVRRTTNAEQRTSNLEPNPNTNREASTTKFERQDRLDA
jgi:hypothetical protein